MTASERSEYRDGKARIKLGLVILVIGLFLLIPGCIGAYVYRDNPETDTCYRSEDGGLEDYPCSNILQWSMYFSLVGISMVLVGLILAVLEQRILKEDLDRGLARS